MSKGGSQGIEETSESRKAAQTSLEQYALYHSTFKPFEDKAIASVTSQATADHTRDLAKQHINADSAQILDKAARGMADPSRGGVRAALYDDGRSQAQAKSAAAAERIDEQQHAAGLDVAVNLGSDQQQQALKGLNDISVAAEQQNITDQVNHFNTNQAILSAGSTLAGGMARGVQNVTTTKEATVSPKAWQQVGMANGGAYTRMDGLH